MNVMGTIKYAHKNGKFYVSRHAASRLNERSEFSTLVNQGVICHEIINGESVGLGTPERFFVRVAKWKCVFVCKIDKRECVVVATCYSDEMFHENNHIRTCATPLTVSNKGIALDAAYHGKRIVHDNWMRSKSLLERFNPINIDVHRGKVTMNFMTFCASINPDGDGEITDGGLTTSYRFKTLKKQIAMRLQAAKIKHNPTQGTPK